MFRTIILSATAFTFALGGVAEDATSSSKIVEEISGKTVNFLADDQLEAQEMERLLAYVDVDGIARFALGKYGARISDDAYSAYEKAFRGYLKSQIQEHLTRFSDGDVQVEDSIQRGNQSIVETTVTKPDGETLKVNWRLRKTDMGWEVIDVEAMNLWLAIEQRAQFQAELDASGGDIQSLIRNLSVTG